jgi:hypothetical protein
MYDISENRNKLKKKIDNIKHNVKLLKASDQTTFNDILSDINTNDIILLRNYGVIIDGFNINIHNKSKQTIVDFTDYSRSVPVAGIAPIGAPAGTSAADADLLEQRRKDIIAHQKTINKLTKDLTNFKKGLLDALATLKNKIVELTKQLAAANTATTADAKTADNANNTNNTRIAELTRQLAAANDAAAANANTAGNTISDARIAELTQQLDVANTAATAAAKTAANANNTNNTRIAELTQQLDVANTAATDTKADFVSISTSSYDLNTNVKQYFNKTLKNATELNMIFNTDKILQHTDKNTLTQNVHNLKFMIDKLSDELVTTTNNRNKLKQTALSYDTERKKFNVQIDALKAQNNSKGDANLNLKYVNASQTLSDNTIIMKEKRTAIENYKKLDPIYSSTLVELKKLKNENITLTNKSNDLLTQNKILATAQCTTCQKASDELRIQYEQLYDVYENLYDNNTKPGQKSAYYHKP